MWRQLEAGMDFADFTKPGDGGVNGAGIDTYDLSESPVMALPVAADIFCTRVLEATENGVNDRCRRPLCGDGPEEIEAIAGADAADEVPEACASDDGGNSATSQVEGT